jgi:hypothetical protein
MSSKNNEQAQQGSLFKAEDLEFKREIKIIDGYEVPVIYGHEGSYMNTVQRAGNLFLALDAMSKRNSREGISVAAYTNTYSAPIWERYQEATSDVLDGASRNRNKYQNRLRQQFWAATGFSALRGMGLMREHQINPRAQKMWRDFNKEYGHPDKLKERNNYKKMLKVQIDAASDEQLELVA